MGSSVSNPCASTDVYQFNWAAPPHRRCNDPLIRHLKRIPYWQPVLINERKHASRIHIGAWKQCGALSPCPVYLPPPLCTSWHVPRMPPPAPHNLLQPAATTTNKFYATAAPVTAGGGSQVKSIERLRGVRHPKSQEGGGVVEGDVQGHHAGVSRFFSFFPSCNNCPPPSSSLLLMQTRCLFSLRAEYIQAIRKTKC